MNNKKLQKIYIIVFVICFLMTSCINISKNHTICHSENYLLLREYIGMTNATTGGDCSDGCYMIDVIPLKNSYILSFIKSPPTEYQKKMLNDMKQTLYFSKEKRLHNFKPYSQIVVRWCKTEKGKRIRGIYEVNN